MIAALVLVLLQEERTREVLYVEKTVEILAPVAGEARHRSTVVSFPEESLEALVVGWNEEDLSVERRRDRLFVKLLRRAEGDLHVLGASGTLYRLYVRPAEKVFDGHVRIVLPGGDASRPTSVDLLRAMRRGKVPAGVTVRRASGRVYEGERFALSSRYVYDGESYRGYVLVLENRTREPLRLDLSRFSGEGLDLVGATSLVVESEGRTRVYFVYGK